MSDYTPTTAKVRDSYTARHIPKGVRATVAKEEFDRFLAEYDAKVRAEEREQDTREPSAAEVRDVLYYALRDAGEGRTTAENMSRKLTTALIAAQEVRDVA